MAKTELPADAVLSGMEVDGEIREMHQIKNHRMADVIGRLRATSSLYLMTPEERQLLAEKRQEE